jgi:alkylation response protein AidB-like acyl-CoA dehydrogenase
VSNEPDAMSEAVLEPQSKPAATPASARGKPKTAWSPLIERLLAPLVVDIDTKAVYPETFLRALGQAGAFRGVVSPEYGGDGSGMRAVISAMDEVARTCMSTGFMVWCQTAAARYLDQSDNTALKARLLPRVASGELLAGTGLSNTVKSCDGVEDSRLHAVRVPGGYRVNGVLPWVSNLGEGHVFVTGCPVEGADAAQRVFFLVDCSAPDFKMVQCATFVALEGTRTLACQFRDTFIADANVLAHPAQSQGYIRRIKPGMVLAQMGMGLGLIDACIGLMHEADRTHAHVNQYLDDRPDELQPLLDDARQATLQLADTLSSDPLADVILPILKLRLAGGELSVRAAHSAMLHQGAKGYLLRNAAQRRLREAYFVAIVTPATKHLRKEIARLEAGCGTCAASL